MLICLIGTGGTGKSTLAQALAEDMGMEYYSTPTRKVPLELRGTDAGQRMVIDLYYDFFNDIVDASWDKNIICDRSVFDVMAYSRAYGAWDDNFIKVKMSQYKSSYVYPDHLFYLPIEFDLVPDNDREFFSDTRELVDESIKWILNINKTKYHTITGTVEQRLDSVKEIILR